MVTFSKWRNENLGNPGKWEDDMNKTPMIGLGALAFVAAVGLATTPMLATESGGADAAAKMKQGKSATEMEWQLFGEGPATLTVLWGDMSSGGEFAMLVKLPPGFEAPPHTHSNDYNGVNLAGTWIHTYGTDDTKVLPPGSYVHQPGGQVHSDKCAGPGECIFLIHQHAAFDFAPVE
jgi:quercetin dioxygenase-like cupin family protein